MPQEYETWHGGFYVNQGKLRFKMGADTAEDVNLITGTKKRNLGLRRVSSDDDDSDDSETEKKEKSPKKKAPEKVKEKTTKVSQEKATKEKPKVAPQKTVTATPKPDMKKPTSPGRSSQRSPRSPARLIMEKSTPTPPPVAPSTPDEADQLPADTPPKLRELCGTLRQIAELQKALGFTIIFT